MDFILTENADIYCFQETKAHPDQLEDNLKNIPGYTAYFCAAERAGYSGTAIYTKVAPLQIKIDLGHEDTDREGRVVMAQFPDFYLFNVYFPNGGNGPQRLAYKLRFYEVFLDIIEKLRHEGNHIIFCGDINTAHEEIDLARPKENQNTSGFMRIERDWIDTLIEKGYVDTFRLFNPHPGHYSWWDYKTKARERNVGWRIDYFFCDREFAPRIKQAGILPHILGSDHCPITLDVSVE